METRDQISGRTEPAAPPRITLRRALGEILAVYIPSFGLGILSALILLTDRSQGADQITGPVTAMAEILQYVMQASVTIFGVGYFCQRRGVTLSQLFGRFKDPDTHPAPGHAPIYSQPPPLLTLPPDVPQSAQPVQPPQPSQSSQPPQTQLLQSPQPPQFSVPGPPFQSPQPPPGVFWPGYPHYMPPRPPVQRSRGWQFSRAYFISMAGVLGFLISVIVYSAITHDLTGAPSQGNSAYLALVGLFVAFAAGFGEEMLVTGLTVNALEAAGITGKRVWLIYLVAVCLRIPFHLYYGWAALGVIIFTVVNIWVYRRWRLLWPIVLAHATYDFVESLGAVTPSIAGLLLLALGLATLVMVIVVVCIEVSDRSARRRFEKYQDAALAAQAQAQAQSQAQAQAYAQAQAQYTGRQAFPSELPPLEPPQLPPVAPPTGLPFEPQVGPASSDAASETTG